MEVELVQQRKEEKRKKGIRKKREISRREKTVRYGGMISYNIFKITRFMFQSELPHVVPLHLQFFQVEMIVLWSFTTPRIVASFINNMFLCKLPFVILLSLWSCFVGLKIHII